MTQISTFSTQLINATIYTGWSYTTIYTGWSSLYTYKKETLY